MDQFFFAGTKSNAQKQAEKQQAQQAAAAAAAQKKQEPNRSGVFGPFPRGPKGLVEKSNLIKHSPRRQDDIQRMQTADRNTTNAENQAFLKDVCLIN